MSGFGVSAGGGVVVEGLPRLAAPRVAGLGGGQVGAGPHGLRPRLAHPQHDVGPLEAGAWPSLGHAAASGK